MMFHVGPWELAIVLSKTLSYLGLASLSGGLFVWWLGVFVEPLSSPRPSSLSSPHPWALHTRRRLVHWLLLACAIGSVSVLLFFLLQVGVINQRGVPGMFDVMMMSLLAQSSVGYGAGLKLAGFAVAGVTLLLCRSDLLSSDGRLPVALRAGWLLSTFLFAISFAILGHIAELGLLPRIAITGHVIVVGVWIGALYPLHLLLTRESPVQLQLLLRIFGTAGWLIIGILLATGVTLVWQVLGHLNELFTTPYGLQLLTKFVLVSALLCLGALNKFRLVPALDNARGQTLRRSIAAEMALAFFILLVTAFMTTITGPLHLM